ncbi:Nif3-like dinuclear metal center hexameric protein [Oceanobacillus piezotolerans]|uniref:GTP cyclohydrolase 1 type 2 homolog n=1 Tax=Oceanobacillus piezotolerans TaxID=2448030 RepID=A0A498DAQ1_9BACI|nr:Nif3-like dinuclear metal center hexameric protein [Oceanobacillus piezotolerans]RLL48061.1 Nif3-like dinuclear metal center hexameric protein [Oceanobacillus piezotolerans]
MKEQVNHIDIFRYMEEWAPRKLAYDWDSVGLQVGSYNHKVKKVMVTLDVMESVVDEAIAESVNLIISHHPMLFKPLNQLNLDTPKGRMIKKLVENDITVYSAHTNLDIASGGVNDILCEYIGIENTEVLLKEKAEHLFKVVVYVPETHADVVREALAKSGAGHIGNYSHCTFQSDGQGTFKPLEGTNPFIGEEGQLEYVDEVKIETIAQEGKLSETISELVKAHPYEEPAYDVFPLRNEGQQYGIGRIGTLPVAMSLKELGEKVKQELEMEHIRITGDFNKKVRKVAVLGGSGEKYIHLAKQRGADVYITGDMSFHYAQDAWQMGLSVIDAGHYIEKVMKDRTKDYLNKRLKDLSIDVITSNTKTDPFQFI